MKKILNWLFAGMLAFGVGGLAITMSITAENETPAIISSLIELDGVTATAESDAAKTYTGDDRKGILLTGENSGSAVTFVDEFSGKFEADFRVFTEREYEADEYASSSFHPEYGVNKLTFTFTDKADAANAFKVVFENDSDFRALPQVYVEKDGVKAGIFYRCRMAWNNDGNQEPAGQPGNKYYRYHEYNKANKETKLANNGGVYTYILDSTFGNLKWFNDTLQAESDSVVFGFDAHEMSVYVRSRGTVITVWDFSETINDGKNFGSTLSGFGEYTVSAEFTEVTGNGAKMMLYSVNGESLGGTAVTDEKGPSVKAEGPAFVMTGDEVAVPVPYAFDMTDKNLAAGTVSVAVTDPAGSAVTVTGLADGKYADGAKFTADVEGDYTITYTVADANKHSSSATLKVHAYSRKPDTEFAFVNMPADVTAGAGNTLRFEMPEVSNSLIPVTVKAEISKENEVLFTAEEGDYFSYKFETAGVYTLTYTVPETGETVSATITVTDTDPVFAFAGEQADIYNLGAKIDIVSATANIGGNSAECYSVVEFPDGTRYQNTYFVASQVGVYRVRYYATVGGVTYSAERSFAVEIDTGSLFEEVTNAEVTAGAVSRYADDQYGTMITTTGTGTVRYTHPINFTNKTRNDAFIEFYMTPAVWNVIETRKVHFTLTDTEDTNNYITIEVRNNLDMDNMSDVKASANGQILKGLRGDVVFTQDQWGTMINHSFLKYVSTVKLVYDNETKCIYANNTLVIDLDNPLHFDTPFKGFTNGTATLTIETVETVASEVSLMVKNIDGVSLESAVIKDITGPQIIVDTQGYKELPVGAVDHPYAVFSASAYDVIDGVKNVYVNVYRKMYGINVAVPVKNGVFTPEVAGDYVIQYTSKDASGNVSTVEYPVTVLEEDGAFTLELDKTDDTTPVGAAYELPAITALSDHGNVTVTTELLGPDGKVVETSGGSFVPELVGTYEWTVKGVDYIGREREISFELDVQGNDDPVIEEVDLPKIAVAGEEMILPDFVAKDYSGGSLQTAKKSIDVTFKGVTTTLESDRAYTPEMTADDDNFLPLTITYRAETATGNKDSKSYSMIIAKTKGTIPGTETPSRPEGMSGYIMPNFFYGAGAFEVLDEAASAAGTTKPLIYRTTQSNATLQYVRPMIAQNATLSFYMRGGADSITVRMTDSLDSSVSIAFRYAKSTATDGESTLTILGDDTVYEVGGTFDTDSKEFRIAYNDNTRYLTATTPQTSANKDIGYVNTMPDGSEFTGFPSGQVYITLELGNVTENADVRIIYMGNRQSFSNTTTLDLIPPMLGTHGTYPQMVQKGDKLEILTASASDVLTNVTATVSVYAPDGTALLENQAITQTYSVDITQFGYYRVVYNIKEVSGTNSQAQTFPVYCVSNEPITIVPDVEIPSKLALNTTWTTETVPTFHVTGGVFEDTTTADDKAIIVKRVIVIDPDFVFTPIKSTAGENEVLYTFSKKGVYTVRFYAQDPDYNTTYVDYTVTVS